MKKNYNCESSETTRETSNFNFNDFYKYGHVKHVPRISEEFLEWFIGFFEGNGSLSYTENTFYNRTRNEKIYKQYIYEQIRFSVAC